MFVSTLQKANRRFKLFGIIFSALFEMVLIRGESALKTFAAISTAIKSRKFYTNTKRCDKKIRNAILLFETTVNIVSYLRKNAVVEILNIGIKYSFQQVYIIVH